MVGRRCYLQEWYTKRISFFGSLFETSIIQVIPVDIRYRLGEIRQEQKTILFVILLDRKLGFSRRLFPSLDCRGLRIGSFYFLTFNTTLPPN